MVRVLPEHFVIATLGRLLQQEDGLRIIEVILTGAAPLVFAAGTQITMRARGPLGRVGHAVANGHFFGEFVEADATHAGGGPGEILVDDILVQTNGFEQLGATIAHDGGDAHLGHDLEYAGG